MRENARIRDKIGSIPVMSDGCPTDDNVAIALTIYFESLPECPDDDTNNVVGWSQWAMDKTNDVLDRIAGFLRPSNPVAVCDKCGFLVEWGGVYCFRRFRANAEVKKLMLEDEGFKTVSITPLFRKITKHSTGHESVCP